MAIPPDDDGDCQSEHLDHVAENQAADRRCTVDYLEREGCGLSLEGTQIHQNVA